MSTWPVIVGVNENHKPLVTSEPQPGVGSPEAPAEAVLIEYGVPLVKGVAPAHWSFAGEEAVIERLPLAPPAPPTNSK